VAKKLNKRTNAEYQAIGKLLEDTYMANSSTKSKVLWFSFLRGLFYGLGIFIAGTLVVGILIWILGLFDNVPLVGPFIEKIVNNLDSSPKF
jgi:hypothetical protein